MKISDCISRRKLREIEQDMKKFQRERSIHKNIVMHQFGIS